MLPIIAVQTGIAIWLYRYFARNERGSKEPVSELRKACFFGVLAVLFAGYINAWHTPDSVFDTIELQPIATVFRAALLVGINEELLKFVPLAIYIRNRKNFNELTDGIVYFALAGMWFGVLENITYTLQYGAGVGLMRAALMPFLHAAFTALAGIGLVRYKFVTKRVTTIFWWLGLAIAAHALYDFLLFYGAPITVISGIAFGLALNWSLFYMYRRMQRVDKTLGNAAVGENRFCRKCGYPNTKRYLYCLRCGKKT